MTQAPVAMAHAGAVPPKIPWESRPRPCHPQTSGHKDGDAKLSGPVGNAKHARSGGHSCATRGGMRGNHPRS